MVITETLGGIGPKSATKFTNMKKALSLLFLALVCCIQTFAERITEQEALQTAQEFLVENLSNNKENVGLRKADTKPLHLAHSTISYFAFNRGENEGFVLVAADNQCFSRSVLGFSEKGNFDTDNMPDNMRWWLAEYDRMLHHYTQNIGSYRQETILKTTQNNYSNIEPLIKSKWNQSSPYNDFCPTYKNVKCPTGCVATAVSQLIYYHRYPEKGTGSHSYEWFVDTVSQGILSSDFSQHTYDYKFMTETYGDMSLTISKEAVARLMYDVGIASNMSYGPTASGTDSHSAARGLINHFSYDKSTILLNRDFYEDEEWIDMLYTNLSKNMPLYYSGVNESAGHAFVCDGYMDGYFHINWGWGGYYDGYFLIDALNPDGQGIGGSNDGYNMGQDAIFNLHAPQTENDYIPLMYCSEDFDISIKEHSPTSNGVFTGFFYNAGMTTRNLTLGLKVVGSDKTITWIPALRETADLDVYYGYNQIHINFFSFPTVDGKYRVYPAYRDNATQTWYEMRTLKSSKKQYLIASVSDKKIVFSNPQDETPDNPNTSDKGVLQFSDWSSTEVIAGKEFNLQGKITCLDTSFFGIVRVAIVEAGGQRVMTYSNDTNLNLTSGHSVNASFSLKAPTQAGNYDFFLVDDNWSVLSKSYPIVVKADTNGELILSLNDLEIKDAENVTINDIHITAKIRCESGQYSNGYVAFAIFPENGGSSIDFSYQDFSIEAGETKPIYYTGSFNGLEEGKSYYAAIFYYLNEDWIQLGYAEPFHVAIQSDIENTKNDNSLTETYVYNLSGVLVLHFESGESPDIKGLVPGVYILKSGKTNKLIVVQQ